MSFGGRRSYWGQVAVVLSLLVAPGCDKIIGLTPPPPPDPPPLNPGSPPRTYAILCDIERKSEPRRCATPEEVSSGAIIPQSSAAVALNVRATSNASLDYSVDAKAACGGLPQVVTYEGAYPEGAPACVKYLEVIGPGRPYANPNAVCVAVCNDLHRVNDLYQATPSEAQAFCQKNARASTNFPISDDDVGLFGLGGFLGACAPEGVLRPDFDLDDPQQPALIDPRRVSDPVEWDPATLVGVTVVGSAGNNLERTKAGSGVFDAGAASSQVIDSGDAYLEFKATETNRRRRIGLAFGNAPNPDPGANHIAFGIELGGDGIARVVEGGAIKATYGNYTAGQTFRINVKDDNSSGTATISYSTLMAPCPPGVPCAENVFYTHASAAPVSYPFHTDTSFFVLGGTLTDVRILRIK
jgi:hypothetical protein